ncbi:MAG: tetratricopeptide repeat protein, partial [Chromatiales bacterium]|nr:tetratricopeptide repeat protein [Chromatiales bacterium]
RAMRSLEVGDLTAGEEGLREALRRAPKLTEARVNLGLLLANNHRLSEAATVLAEGLESDGKNPRFLAVQSEVLQALNDLPGAVAAAEAWVNSRPNDPAAAARLGQLLHRQGDFRRAVGYLESALRADPAWVDGRMDRALGLFQLGDEKGAHGELEELLRRYPDDLAVVVNVGAAFRLIGDTTRALSLGERALRTAPLDPDVLNNLALCYVDKGQMDEAERCYAKALEVEPANASVWYNRVRIRRYNKEDSTTVDALRHVIVQTNPGGYNRMMGSFALGKVLNDMGDYGGAFEQYDEASRIRRANIAYDAIAQQQRAERIKRAWTPRRCAAVVESNDDFTPILIVGMPRSGTTLVEQILGRHPLVTAGGEQRVVPALAQRLDAQADTLRRSGAAEFTVDEWGALREHALTQYLRVAGDRTVLTDKLPTNFEHLGLAARCFSRLRVVHCRRHPMDTCLANFMQFFTEGHDYSYDLADIAHFYGVYRELMAHWEAVLPMPILNVDYEEVIDDLAGQARRLVEYVGLPWHEACANHGGGAAAVVATASNWQVRQPIYRDAAQRWKRYGDLLDPLARALALAGVNFEP